jgi:GNAT superfamily N-acetyltransferase
MTVHLKNKKPDSEAPMKLEWKELSRSTWDDFVELFEKHGGVCGGCWCTFFHFVGPWGPSERNKRIKKQLLFQRSAHGVLMYHEGVPVGWCQFGPRKELPRIDDMKNYKPVGRGRFWRITCFFVDRDHRGRGVAREALRATLTAMRRHGARLVEAYPVDTGKKRCSPSALYKGSLGLFEEFGFKKVGELGGSRVIVQKKL